MKFTKPKKQPKANWTTAFPKQQAALHPERTETGGVKAQSGSEKQRSAVYHAIRDVWLATKIQCDARIPVICDDSCNTKRNLECHHKRGRSGLLLFDLRHWSAICPSCHAWIHANEDRARELGLLCDRGDWRKSGE
jgi:hypothetical protein